MSLSRRSLVIKGGAAALVLTAGGGSFLLTRRPDAALIPWQVASQMFADPRLQALSYAILAPNPHNRQPWLVELRGEHELVLYCDLDRTLPETDPEGRQIMIGLGCFLELLRLAASEQGQIAEIDTFPEGSAPDRLTATPIARVTFRQDQGERPDPLMKQVLKRRSNKEPFDLQKPVTSSDLRVLNKAAGSGSGVASTNDPARVATLRDLTWRAMETELRTPRANLECVRLMRIGKAEIEANPDGIDLGGPFLETLSLLGELTREGLADPNSAAFQQGLDLFRGLTGTAMAHIWVITEDNSRNAQLAAGRAWLRVNLKATELGLSLQPLSQALQEYLEVQPYFEEVHKHLAAGHGRRIQMLGRLGYGPEIDPSPRWPLATRLRKAS
ncbi:MAG: twin-arginine translocation pathway signal protein [Alphaproteobacteria bacterium]|nr:twin-arginine translocation pathway signal protein [Alphaproteobacteria bacterium]